MQGLADGYFVLPYTIGDYLARNPADKDAANHPACAEVEREVTEHTDRLLSVGGSRSADSLQRELGKVVTEACGMSRNAERLRSAIGQIAELREKFWKELRVPGSGADLNQSLELAGRVADFFELAELMCRDALERDESCGAHFRVEHTTDEGEAQRDDERFSHNAVWEFTNVDEPPRRHIEPLTFEYVMPTQRSYK